MFAPIARITDMHLCPMITPGVPPIPHVGGPVVGPGAPTVMAGGLPVSVIGDMAVCVGPPDVMVLGAFTVLAQGRPVVRISDVTAHGGAVIVGLPTVMVGDSGGSSSAQGGAMKAAKAGGSAFLRTDCTKKAAEGLAKAAAVADTGVAWVEVEVVDQQGKPIAYQKVHVTDSGGTLRVGFTNKDGLLRINGMAKGECVITLPDLDREVWQAP